MNTLAKNAGGRLRLKITLEHFKPAIWRRVEVDDDLTFGDFHRVIQVAMGWDDDHLHEFQVAGQRVSMPTQFRMEAAVAVSRRNFSARWVVKVHARAVSEHPTNTRSPHHG